MNAQQLAQVAITVLIVLILIWMITGCEALQQRDMREGKFIVDADCGKQKVNVQFELDQHGEGQSVEIRK